MTVKNLGIHAQKGSVPWNKGLDKSDPRVLKYAQKRSLWLIENHPTRGKKNPGVSFRMRGSNHPMFGKHHSSASIEKIRLAKIGKNKKDISELKTPINILERRKFQREVQKKVFERDQYTCQICGIRGVSLQVDHIQSWSEYVELRFDINNCRTLCMKCHYKITFGREMPSEIRTWGHNLSNILGDK